jgi:hypothetical protein
VVQGYESALATGGYASACNFLTPKTRALLARRAGKSNCPAAIASCLPNDAIIPKKDQSQLLYANVVTVRHGSTAEVSISGNPVARAIGRVSLRPKPGGWILTSYGEGFTGCSNGQAKAHHRRH